MRIINPFDFSQFREGVVKASELAVRELFPIITNKYSVELEKIHKPQNIEEDDFAKEQEIKEKRGTVALKAKVDVVMRDKNTGEVLERKTINNFQIPKATKRGSFIVEGNEYQVANQLRLDPAVYTYVDNAGITQTQFNLEKGKNFKMNIDPRTNKFRFRVGTSHYDAYPIMKATGVTDEQMRKAWGEKLWYENSNGYNKDDLNKFHQKVIGGNMKTSSQDVSESIKNYFNSTIMNPDTNSLTIGSAEKNITPSAFINATKKYLDVANKKVEQDERDDLRFQTLNTTSDLLLHRAKKLSKDFKRKMAYKIDSKKTINGVITASELNKPITTFFTSSELSAPTEQINPLHSITNVRKITRMGEGGIASSEMVTDKARSVHPSQYGFLDPYQTVEGSRVGVTTSLTASVRKREDGRLVTKVWDLRDNKFDFITPKKFRESYVAMEDQFESYGGSYRARKPKISALFDNKPIIVDSGRVRYVLPKDSAYALNPMLIPFQNSNQGNRTMMAAKQMPQHNLLKERNEPLVQVLSFGKETIEKRLGENMAIIAEDDGSVLKIDDSFIYVNYQKLGNKKIPFYKEFILNQGAYLDHEILIKAGQKFKKGDVIADSNSTKNGKWAPGKDLRVAYMPFKGYNYEDGIVISETAAKKLTSMHMHRFDAQVGSDDYTKKNRFVATFPAAFSPKQLANLDDDGVVKNGSIVNYGDPVILYAKRKNIRQEDLGLGSISKKLNQPYSDKSQIWSYEFPAEVISVSKSGKISVRLRSEEPAKQGDKLSGRHGNKGIISKIMPDGEMPQNRQGEPMEIILNPQGVIGRINPSQILETALGKVANKRGKAVKVENFHPDNDNYSFVLKKLKDAGLEEDDELIDPKTGESYGRITNGFQHMLKLDHPVRKKLSARSIGPTYNQENQPEKGDDSAQSIGPLEMYALLSHGAKDNMREISTIKSDRNDDFWNRFQSGMNVNIPKKLPFVTQKLFDHMKVLGFDLEKKNNTLIPTPFSDDQIKALSRGEVRNGRILKSKDASVLAEDGGLFDPKIFGSNGVDGKAWGHVELAKKIPNPFFEDAILAVTGLTKPKYESIMKGKEFIYEKTAEEKKTGPEAIASLLSKIDVDSEYERLKQEANQTSSKTKRDQIFRKMKYLRGLKRTGMGTDAYLMKSVPILPPQLRSVVPLPDGNMVVPDINYAYKDLISVNNALKDEMNLGLGGEEDATFNLYQATKALQGFGKPVSYGKDFKGVADVIKGGRNKSGFFQGKVVKRRQEMSGRSTVIPNPDLGLDNIGLPEEMSWKIFEPHIRREMSTLYSANVAQKMIEDKDPAARKFLEKVMNEKNVLINRAPTLHRGSLFAMKPVLVSGKAIQTPNLINAPLNLDHDGDTISIHVPVTNDAQEETKKMLPSSMLFNPMNRGLYFVPTQEMILGLYQMTRNDGEDTGLKFNSLKEAMRDKQKIGNYRNKITVGGIKAPLGLHIVNSFLPKDMVSWNRVIDKKTVSEILKKVGKDHKDKYADIVNSLKDWGIKASTGESNTIRISDFANFEKEKISIMANMEREISNIDRSKMGDFQKDEKKVQVWEKTMGDFKDAQKKFFSQNRGNNVGSMFLSGSRGSDTQIMQTLAAPMLVQDFNGKPLPFPIKNNYIQGQSMLEDVVSSQSARFGAVQKAKGVAEPGAYAKSLVAANMQNIITEEDCGTRNFIVVDVKDSVGRFCAENIPGVIRIGEPIDSEDAEKIGKKKDRVSVRSQFKCESKQGVCVKCYGLNEHLEPHRVGDNVGVRDAQSLAEPLTQGAMKVFHLGGLAETKKPKAQGYERIKQLYDLPEELPNRGVLSDRNGVVEKIETSPAGGFDIFVSGKKIYSPSEEIMVKPGQSVKIGDKLSFGHYKPQEMVKYMGVDKTREYLVDELKKSFKESGAHIDRRVFETLANVQTSFGKIITSNDDDILPGDVTKISRIDAAKKNGKNIIYEPMVRPINRIPLDDTVDSNMFQNLNFRELDRGLKKNVAFGNKVEVSNTVNPIASYIMGNFGRNENDERIDLY